MINSFFPWIGGKKLLRSAILARFPPQHDRYVEVFGGAAWILFAKPPERHEIYNDYNSDLTNLFYAVKYKHMEFLHELSFLSLNGKEEFDLMMAWNKQQDFTLPHMDSEMELAKRYLSPVQFEEYCAMVREKASLGDVRRAANFYKLIRYSYAGGSSSFNGQPVDLMQNYQTIWLANRRLNENGVKTSLERRQADGAVGDGVSILNKSYADLLPMVSRAGTFAYCDPPYYGTEKLYEKRFSLEDHYHLHELACDFAGYIMLSYNDCEFIRDLYQGDFHVESVERMNSIAQRYNPGGVYKELIITNYDPNEKRNQQPKQLSLLTS